jgi:hypothetical protein
LIYCYEPECGERPEFRLWDGDDDIVVCEHHVQKHKRAFDIIEKLMRMEDQPNEPRH